MEEDVLNQKRMKNLCILPSLSFITTTHHQLAIKHQPTPIILETNSKTVYQRNYNNYQKERIQSSECTPNSQKTVPLPKK